MTEKNKIDLITGYIDENELNQLVGAGDVTPNSTWWCATIGITLSAGPCPTSACTKDC
ncbi:class II lanthipeptide, LchA2/BrtA2 family [Baia soyae]|uniref:Lantibiotic n=1 Tax=Baia soyae TaxID=1544746 RepID=A0A4R2S212_9BACL|nr:class II lanthipeptide, LchA2/BrtA2 family [Baia soyae]TCP70221.1 hypothetical protein EDD57_10334 [Baia soyae]